MSKSILVLVSLLFASIASGQAYLKSNIYNGNKSVEEIIKMTDEYFQSRPSTTRAEYKHYQRWKYNARRLQDENGYLRSAYEELEELHRYNALLNKSQNQYRSAGDWEELGPFYIDTTSIDSPGLGRITSLGIEKENTDHIIAGSETGGIWKTTDKGKSWTPLTDSYANLHVYALTIAPYNKDTYFWGSDQGYIYKSIDGGESWSLLARDISWGKIVKIAVHPTDPNILFAAAEYDNLYKSFDGGKSWTEFSTYNGGFDVEFKPDDPNVVYATGHGFFKSTNGGKSFVEINANMSQGPKMLAVTPADPDVVYVVEAHGTIFGALYKSTNQGNSFTKLSHNKNYFGNSPSGFDNTGQAPRDMDIAVSPQNSDILHIAGIVTWRSEDGGINFDPTSDWRTEDALQKGLGYCHGDTDVIEYVGNEIFYGTDGGVYVTEEDKEIDTSYFTHLSNGMGINQIYRFGISQTENVIISAGSQDNGTSFYQDGKWRQWLGGDGMETFVDKNDPKTIYGTTEYGKIHRKEDIPRGYVFIGNLEQGNWITPMEQDPSSDDTFYVGYSAVYKMTEKGNRFESISQTFNFQLDHLKVAKNDNKTLYASAGSELYRTTDGGASAWSVLTVPGAINAIAIHPDNPKKIAIATTSLEKVLVSENGGNTWESYGFNLPNFAALSLAWQTNGNEGLYLGMNYGVYFLEEGTQKWLHYRSNLPNVIINELEINETDGHLYAATYGRGVWRTPLYSTVSTADKWKYKSLNIYPNPATDYLNVELDSPTSVELIMYDNMGRIVKYKRHSSPIAKISLNTKQLPKGIYALIVNRDGGSQRKRVVIQ